MDKNLTKLPKNLPVPIDDGAAAHLKGSQLPNIELISTDGDTINLANLIGLWVIYIYPMTGRPDVALPVGWNDIPGARGCTPQSCGFRDHYSELMVLKANVLGISAQSTEYQREVKDRLHLPYKLLSDSTLKLKHAVGLPTFNVAGMELFKRITLITENGLILKVFYPVFPPDLNSEKVLEWLRESD